MRRQNLFMLTGALALAACAGDAALVGMPEEAAVDATEIGFNPIVSSVPAATVEILPAPTVSRTLAEPLLNLEPTLLEATLLPGETVTEHKTVSLPAAPPKADVVFAMDLSGSMQNALNNMKNNSVNIMNGVAAQIPDVQFAFASYEDYALIAPPASQNCGHGGSIAGARYGDADYGDAPWRLNQALTATHAAISSALQTAFLGYGGDLPESYSRAFYELYAELIGEPNTTEGVVGWREGARRIVINWSDDIPHDCNYRAIVGQSGSTGRDPGRDGVFNNADDLAILDVLDGLKANDVTVINLFIPRGSPGVANTALWNAYMARAGGTNYVINANGTFPTGVDPTTAIVDLISNAVTTISNLRLQACPNSVAYASWIQSVDPAAHTDVALPADKEFDLVVGPPVGTPPGTYTFDVCAVGDGAEFGRQQVEIEVLEPNRAPAADAGGPYAGIEASAVSFTAAGSSDPDGDALTYAWDFGDGASGSGETPSHTYADNGSYTVTVTASDPDGLSNSASTTATIGNVAPTVSIGPGASILSGENFTLAGSFTDPGVADDPWAWTITWDDGGEDNGVVASSGAPIGAAHTFFAPGSYTVTLSVSDKDGDEDAASATVTVSALAMPVEVRPEAIRLNDKGNGTITVVVDARAGIDLGSLDVSSLRLTNGTGSGTPLDQRGNALSYTISASQGVFNFSRSELIGNGDLTATTTLLFLEGVLTDGRHVAGSDAVRVIQ